MLNLISSIPTTMREGFDVQDLPHRATPLSAEHLSKVFGGACIKDGNICANDIECCNNGRLTKNCVKDVNGVKRCRSGR